MKGYGGICKTVSSCPSHEVLTERQVGKPSVYAGFGTF